MPTANWLLAAGTILVVLMFKTSDNLASAYGIAVSGTMLITTLLLYRVAIGRWNWPPVVAVAVIAGFAAIEALFFAANSLKIVEGGWFPRRGRRVDRRLDAVLAQRLARGAPAPLRHVDDAASRFLAHLDERVIGRVPGSACG